MQALGFHKRRDAKIGRIAQQPLFATCTEADLRSLAKVCDEVEASSGDILARQGWHGQFPLEYVFPARWIVIIAAFGIVAASLAALLPARRAARIQIVEALRFE